VGLANYVTIFSDASILKYTANTLVMWVIGFIPQIIVSLLLGQWFSDIRLKLKGSRFFKTVIYLPNLIMASAFSMLFFALFSDVGPINSILQNIGLTKEPVRFFSSVWATRGLVGFMNFLMWFGNTTIILMAGIMGIDTSLFEAAEVDGANSWQRFYRITLPLLKPILIYVIITSMIGGIQMFDVPQILTNGSGSPAETSKTLIMYLNQHLYSKNYGLGGALSVFLFIITAILSLIIYAVMYRKKD
jgi:cellobiose transport system permease protein